MKQISQNYLMKWHPKLVLFLKTYYFSWIINIQERTIRRFRLKRYYFLLVDVGIFIDFLVLEEQRKVLKQWVSFHKSIFIFK